MPAWTAVTTADFAYIRTGDVEELYDLTGIRGPRIPAETDDRIDDPAYARRPDSNCGGCCASSPPGHRGWVDSPGCNEGRDP